jgi:hypothetical protein
MWQNNVVYPCPLRIEGTAGRKELASVACGDGFGIIESNFVLKSIGFNIIK